MTSGGGLGLLGLLLLLFAGGARSTPERAPRLPAARIPAALPSGGTLPWPQVLPAGLPPFPGAAWEYDEPPPIVVQQRAGQLVSQLWAKGAGAFRTEQTAGRWITYRAEIVRSGKQGIVAYRLKSERPIVPLKRPAETAVSRSPGVPQAPVDRTVYMPPTVITARKQTPEVPDPYESEDYRPASYPAPGSTRHTMPGGSIDTRTDNWPSPLAMPTLRLGAGVKPKPPNPDVSILQLRLKLDPDGRFGPLTDAAVRRYQKLVGLEPDGVVGTLTWTQLFALRNA